MLNVSYRVSTLQAEKMLLELGRSDQLNFAIARSINAVIEMIQKAVRDDMKSKLALRRIAFNLNGIKIYKWAKKDSLSAILGIDDRLENLLRLETGQDHIPLNGSKYVPVANASFFGNKIITKDNSLSTSKLKLEPFPGGIMKGANGTFLVHSKATGTPVILQRTAKAGKKGRAKKGTDKTTGTRLLYTLVKKSKTTKKLDVRGIATNIVNQYYREEIIKAVNYAIETAKSK